MSKTWIRSRRVAKRRGGERSDEGMTLTELLLSMVITGMVMAGLMAAATVMLRQVDNTEGRTNNARSEQNINLWMPTDLTSAESVDKLPGSVPCGGALPACPPGVDLRGSNALMLTWRGSEVMGGVSVVETLTVVSYRVVREDTGEFRMYRVACYSVNDALATCTSMVVLRELNQPPATVNWQPGITVPTWVITVTDALFAEDVSGVGDEVAPPDPGYRNKGAQRLVVTINGGGDVAGEGGGQKQISLSAGGTNRETGLSTDDLQGTPNFTAARSRCGGNFGMVVDHSGSISQSELNSIKGGIRSFIDTFAGTPIKLQVVTFGDDAATLGTTAGVWGKYFDMLDDTDVATLKGLVGDPLVTSSGIQRGGWTNWEDALFRMLRNSDGTLQAQLPGTMIFFTDGVPTKSRLDYTSASAAVVDDPLDDGLDDDSGSFQQISWNRAERIVRDRGSIKIIGVFVNPDETAESEWIVRGEAYLYEVGNGVVYEVGAPGYRRNNNVIFQISGSNMSYQRKSGSSWVSAASGYSATSSQARAAYLANNTTPDSTDNWRYTKSGSPGSWQTISAAQYAASNTSSGTGDGFRTAVSGGLSSNWTTVTEAEYDLSNTNTGTSDGWDVATVWSPTTFEAYTAGNVDSGTGDNFRTSVSGGNTSWATVTALEYTASNTTNDSTDGWRATYRPKEVLDIRDYATIGNLIVGNTTGVAGGYVEATPRGGPYENVGDVDLFVLPNYTNFSSALASVALDQCGGTVTLQTKVGSTNALDPFTYQNMTSNETVKTSAAFRSGTFDIATPGGAAQTVTITPQEFTDLGRYAPAGWSCKSGGAAYPFTTAPVAGHAPWTSITLTVLANKAVSCTQQVTFL